MRRELELYNKKYKLTSAKLSAENFKHFLEGLQRKDSTAKNYLAQLISSVTVTIKDRDGKSWVVVDTDEFLWDLQYLENGKEARVTF